MACALGFSKAPSSIIKEAPPGKTSSPGWKISLIVPSNWSLIWFKIAAAPSTELVCTSCPQACITPTFLEAKSSPVFSVIGRASISPRMAKTFLDGLTPSMCATIPVLTKFRWYGMPNSSN